jgi:type II secretory pathway pseudopilin PulG
VRKQRSAHTLLEVILVLALLVIIAGITFPTVMSAYGSQRIRAGSDTIRAGFVEARTHAVSESRRYRFSVMEGKGNFRVAPDDPAFWSGSPPQDDQSPAFVYEDELPPGIHFTFPNGGGSGGQWKTVAVFDSDGSADNAEEITLELRGTRPLVITLRALTGSSTVTYGNMK